MVAVKKLEKLCFWGRERDEARTQKESADSHKVNEEIQLFDKALEQKSEIERPSRIQLNLSTTTGLKRAPLGSNKWMVSQNAAEQSHKIESNGAERIFPFKLSQGVFRNVADGFSHNTYQLFMINPPTKWNVDENLISRGTPATDSTSCPPDSHVQAIDWYRFRFLLCFPCRSSRHQLLSPCWPKIYHR
jgi:hypothetical protein